MKKPLRDTDTRQKPVRSNLSEDADQPKLINKLRLALRSCHSSKRTEKVYFFWVKRNEVEAILSQLSIAKWLMVSLMYGAELRLFECLVTLYPSGHATKESHHV